MTEAYLQLMRRATTGLALIITTTHAGSQIFNLADLCAPMKETLQTMPNKSPASQGYS